MSINYIGHNQWNGQDMPNFYNRVKSKKWDKIILFCQNEWEWHMHDPVIFPKLLEYCKSINQPLHVITGSHHHLYPITLENVEVHWWDTYWLGKTYSALINTKLSTTINPYDDKKYKFHFVCMNNRCHSHRAELIDLLEKFNLITNNAVSIHQDSHIYKWKYFKFRKILLEPEFATDRNQHRVPEQYYDSFAQIVSESSGNTIMLSEKTAVPLIIGKPFLVAGQMHFHKFLNNLGFQLYTELFDYSFDNEQNQTTRYEMLLENFTNLSKVSLKDLSKLHKKIAHKIEFNQKKAKQIMFDLNLYPKIALEVIDNYHNTGYAIDEWLIQEHKNLQACKDVSF